MESGGAGCVFYAFGLEWVEGGAVGFQDVVEPDRGNGVALLGSPGVVGLGPAKYKTPVYCPNVHVFEDRQVGCEFRFHHPCHVLRANNGSVLV